MIRISYSCTKAAVFSELHDQLAMV